MSASLVDKLEWLIHPIPVEVFFSEYWEKKPLIVHRENREYYTHLFSKERLDSLFTEKSKLFKFLEKPREFGGTGDVRIVRFVNQKREVMFPSDKHPKYVDHKIADQLFFEEGCTFQVHQPQRFSEFDALAELMTSMESYFGSLFGCNAYISPANTQGLGPHWDEVEVFIVQCEGSKHWKLYPSPRELPQEQSGIDRSKIGEPEYDFVLEQGDFLYFPRGTIHEAIAQDVFSNHLTMSTYQYTSWGKLLNIACSEAIMKAFAHEKRYRWGLPLGFSNFMGVSANENENRSERDYFRGNLRELFSGLADYIDADEVVDEFQSSFNRQRLPPFQIHGEFGKEVQIDDLDLVRIVEPSFYRVIKESSCTDVCTHHHEAKEGSDDDQLFVLSSVGNSRMFHMFSESTCPPCRIEHEDKPLCDSEKRLPLRFLEGIKFLAESRNGSIVSGGFCEVSQIPLSGEDRVKLITDLRSIGLVELRYQ